uniref:G-protein coupled receptors family 1 profile domain-containing protein n=1 Tax=Nannospalax galili TaxID=1026970 RepID=A0A8C6RSG7_NANGA
MKNQSVEVVFIFYKLSLMGNLVIILLTLLDLRLKTPMYSFLRNFSFLEIAFTTVCIPRFLMSILTGNRTISSNAYAALVGGTEFYLLAAMSYDRYVAICRPLHYPVIMNSRVCKQLVLSSWVTGFLVIFPPSLLGLKLDFFASRTIDHFLCDTSVLQLSCTDTPQQRRKAFSTCSSDMVVVSITYGSCVFMYMKTSAKERVTLSKGVAVLNTSVAPLLNPFIYTLRNQQVKEDLKQIPQRFCSFQNNGARF